MTNNWINLYTHGERLGWLCKRFFTLFKKAVDENDENRMIMYGEALRKVTMNCSELARIVLAVEEIIKGKRITR